MNQLLIAVSILGFTVNNICHRLFQVAIPHQEKRIALYQSLFCLTAALCFQISGGSFTADVPTLISGFFFGLLFYLAVHFTIVGFAVGPMSLTGIVSNLNFLIPLLFSCIVLKEPISLAQYAGIAAIFITVLLSAGKFGGNQRPVTGMWLLSILITFLSLGVSSVIQKNYVRIQGDELLMQMMAVAYFTAALAFAVTAAVKQVHAAPEERFDRKSLLLTLLISIGSGIGSYGGNALRGILCKDVPGAILFPCISGGLCILTAVSSFLFFHEKVTGRKIAAILCGVTALILLNLA